MPSMVKRKYIEDSDGDDEETESPTLPADSCHDPLANPQNSQSAIAASTNPRFLDTSGARSDVLTREIACAANQLMQPTPGSFESTKSQRKVSQKFSTTPSGSRSLMKRALSNMESAGPRVKYGRGAKATNRERDLFDFHGSSDGEVEKSSKPRQSNATNEWSIDIREKSDQGPRKVPPIFADFADFAEPKRLETSPPAIFRMPNLASVKDPGLQVAIETPDLPHLEDRVPSQEECSSSDSPISASKTIVVKIPSPKKLQLEYDGMEDELSYSADTRPISNNGLAVLLPQSLERKEDNLSSRDEPIDSEDDVKATRKRKRQGAAHSATDELRSDEVTDEIPQEQYLKRPTRSRSGRDHQELVVPADFSKRPEKVAKVAGASKRKLKRSKTTAFQELRPVDSDEEDEEDLPTNGNMAIDDRTHSQSSAAQNRSPKIEPQFSEDKEAVEATSKDFKKFEVPKPGKKRGRPKKEKATEESKKDAKALKDGGKKSSYGQQPSNKSNSTNEPEAEDNSRSDSLTEDQDSDDNEGALEDGQTKQIPPPADDKVLAQTTGNSTPAKLSEDRTKPASDLPAATTDPETPKKPDKRLGKGTEQHSPISNGKVAYRVGLSKRARIQPLLQIVRK